MLFKVVPPTRRLPETPNNIAYLVTDNWNDWGEFRTMYRLEYIDQNGKRHTIGDVKIGQIGLVPDKKNGRPELPSKFQALDDPFFSVGQDDGYYDALNKLGEEKRLHILRCLRDIAADPNIYEMAKNEKVMQGSLLRSVTLSAIQGQFRRIAGGSARLTPFKFEFAYQQVEVGVEPPQLTFDVTPESHPPTNIHVIIGRNGVGKTRLLKSMTKSVLAPDVTTDEGRFLYHSQNRRSGPFANLVSVTFSAFDRFDPMPSRGGDGGEIKYFYVGLKTPADLDAGGGRPKTPEMLREEFADSVSNCLAGGSSKVKRWRHALNILEADPLFKDAEVARLAEPEMEEARPIYASELFDDLSSGHKIILLTITKMVEVVEESTLVLLDEPEAHLHPPLLAAFVRAVSDLLIDRNGVAIIATHSPVVLQEVPSECVWKLHRTGSIVTAERPVQETFGENVGTLTREVFGLEVTHSGFHRMLQDAVEKEGNYENVVAAFGGSLGAEAKAIVRALLAAKNK